MSLGKLEKVGSLEEIFEGLKLSVKEARQKIIDSFHEAYGRYENVSGSMYFEVCHGNEPNIVHWVKGETGKPPTEDVIIDRESAIKKFIPTVQLGYRREFVALTQEDMDRENARVYAEKSLIDREGLLGTYWKGQEYVRVKEHGQGLFTIETGYGESIIDVVVEQTEDQARQAIDTAEMEGYRLEGKVYAPDTATDLTAFLSTPAEEKVQDGAFDPSWFS